MTAHHAHDAAISDAKIRVRYAETDQMGVVYHANYIVWFEVGRVELLRQLGYAYRDLEADGMHLPVAEVHCRYKIPAKYDDELLIRTRLSNVRGFLIRFGYEVIRAADGALLAEGDSTHIVVGADMQRTSLPEKYLAPFLKAMGNSKAQ